MDNFQVLQNMKPEELQELLQIYRAKNEGQDIGGQMHKPVMVNTMEESLLASLPNVSGRVDPMTGLRSFEEENGDDNGGYGKHTGGEPPKKEDYGGYGSKQAQDVALRTQASEEKDRNKQPPPPPPKYKDKLGREYNTQAEADAANDRIDTQRAQLATAFTDLTTDATWEVQKAEGLPTYADLPESEVKARFDNQLLLATREGASQLQGFGEAMYKLLTAIEVDAEGNPIPGGAFTNLNLTWDEYIAANITEANPTGEPPGFGRLSETTKRSLWELQKGKAQRKEAFDLTPAEIALFERDAVQVPTSGNFQEWWASKGGVGGLYTTEAAAKTAWEAGQVTDASRTAITTPADIAGETIDAPTAEQTTVKDFGFVEGTDEVLYDTEFTEKVRGKSDQAFDILLDTIMGRRPSQAQQMMSRESEKLMKSFLSAVAGTDAAPEKRRQLQNLWAEQGQVLLRDKAELRSQEEATARQQMIQLIEIDGGREAKLALADLEVRRQTAFENADLEQVVKITNAQNKLTSVIAEADTEMKAKMANLSAELEVAKKNGDLDVAVAIAVMQKNLAIASINAELALKSRALDDNNAIEAFKGKKELHGLETKIDMAQMESDLKIMGFELTRDLAEMDDATKRYIAELTGQWKAAEGDTNRQAALLNMIATGIAAYAKLNSDERMKQNISSGDREIEQFLDAIDAYQYEYRDPKAIGRDSGLLIGIMAQDAEKGGPMGNAMVSNGPRGKQLDMNQGLAAVMAAQANLHKRTKQLEGRG